MTMEQVRQLYEAIPFQPFVTNVADGREISVVSREFILIAPRGRILVVAEPNGKLHHIDLLLVTDLVSKLNGSGTRSKRRS